MNNTCQFIGSENTNNCKYKCNYGEYCYKHRREYLIHDDTICRDRFTGLSKDYLKSDLIRYMKNMMRIKPIISDKKILFDEVNKHINAIKEYHLSDNDGQEDSNKRFDEDAWFWPHLKLDVDYFTVEVYGCTPDQLRQQSNLVQTKLQQ